jgi:hypothetical protein
MAIGAYFMNHRFPPASYEKAIADLRAAGHGAPAGRIEHFALLGDNGDIIVFDIWESPEALEAFGSALIPVLTGLGVELVAPTITPLHNRVSS